MPLKDLPEWVERMVGKLSNLEVMQRSGSVLLDHLATGSHFPLSS